jgi:hypothetical protein
MQIAKARGTLGFSGDILYIGWIDGLNGRGVETRTPDRRIWNPVLYQLSYTPSSRSLAMFTRSGL